MKSYFKVALPRFENIVGKGYERVATHVELFFFDDGNWVSTDAAYRAAKSYAVMSGNARACVSVWREPAADGPWSGRCWIVGDSTHPRARAA